MQSVYINKYSSVFLTFMFTSFFVSELRYSDGSYNQCFRISYGALTMMIVEMKRIHRPKNSTLRTHTHTPDLKKHIQPTKTFCFLRVYLAQHTQPNCSRFFPSLVCIFKNNINSLCHKYVLRTDETLRTRNEHT